MAWPRSITLREAKLLAICDVPAPPDMPLPAGWVLGVGGLLVAHVPPLSVRSPLRASSIGFMQVWCQRRGRIQVSILTAQHGRWSSSRSAARIQCFDGPNPMLHFNIVGQRAFLVCLSFDDVITARCSQVKPEDLVYDLSFYLNKACMNSYAKTGLYFKLFGCTLNDSWFVWITFETRCRTKMKKWFVWFYMQFW